MIQGFLESWALFQNTYLAGWAMAFLLALVGVLVVARDQIFIGAAVSQASTLGIALALWLGGYAGSEGFWTGDAFRSAMAVVFSILATLLTARTGVGRETHEAVTGWVFLVSASGAILLMAHSPHGLEEIHRLVASTLIGAMRIDVVLFVALAVAAAVVARRFDRPLLLVATNPVMARAVGLRVRVWNVALAVVLGLVIGLSIRVAGMLYSFGCLVLPALVAKSLCREMRQMFLVAPLVALAVAVVSFILADAWDYPPAQMTVAGLCLTLAAAWSWRALQEDRA